MLYAQVLTSGHADLAVMDTVEWVMSGVRNRRTVSTAEDPLCSLLPAVCDMEE